MNQMSRWRKNIKKEETLKLGYILIVIYLICKGSLEEMGYVLDWVNHNRWFWQVLFHNNTVKVKGLRFQMKRLVINSIIIEINKNYFGSWICYTFFEYYINIIYIIKSFILFT